MGDEAREQLRDYSTRWGNDLHIVQGAGGNSSCKVADRLFVKASGMRLAEASDREIFVDVDLRDALAMADGAPSPTTAGPLRPSIETSLHAVMPHRFVAHFHSVDVLAFAVREDGEAALGSLLDGLRWGWIPYLKPGAAVACAVRALLARGRVDIVVMGNHGVVIGGDSCEAIDSCLALIRKRVGVAVRGGRPDTTRLYALAGRFDLEPARYEDAHLAACDPQNLAFATAGTLYPDHVVFLGRGTIAMGDGGPPADAGSLLYLAPGAGALLPRGAPDEAHEMAACLGATVARIASGSRLHTLTAEQESELLLWDAETYRQSLARSHARAS